MILTWSVFTLWNKPLADITQKTMYSLTMNYAPSLLCIYIFILACPFVHVSRACRQCEHLTKLSPSAWSCMESTYFSLLRAYNFKSRPIMTLTDSVGSDELSTDTPAVTSLTWKRIAVGLIHCSAAECLRWLCLRSEKRRQWHSPLLPADPAGPLRSLYTGILCSRQWRSVGLNWWISTWTRERE